MGFLQKVGRGVAAVGTGGISEVVRERQDANSDNDKANREADARVAKDKRDALQPLLDDGVSPVEVVQARNAYNSKGAAGLTDREKYVLSKYGSAVGKSLGDASYDQVASSIAARIDSDNQASGLQGRKEEERVAGQKADAQVANNTKNIAAANANGKTFAPVGMDATNQGVNEQLWGIHGMDAFAPTNAEKYNNSQAWNYYNPGNGEKTSTAVAQDQFNASHFGGDVSKFADRVDKKYGLDGGDVVKNMTDSVSPDANLGRYYQNAFLHGSGELNGQLASRGMFGSSVGLQMQSGLARDLSAEQANREAQYGLDRAAYTLDRANSIDKSHLGWVGAEGDLAKGATKEKLDYGNSSAANAAAGQDQAMGRIKQGQDAASQVDQGKQDWYNLAFSAAGGAQDRRDRRVQGAFDNKLAFGDAIASGFTSGLTADQAAGIGQIGAFQGAATDKYNVDSNAGAASTQQLYDSLGGLATLGQTFSEWKKERDTKKAATSVGRSTPAPTATGSKP